MIVVLQSKETPIAILFDKARPLNEDKADMSYDTFKTCLTDPKDGRYMDMERLMNTVYPLEKVNEIWPLHCKRCIKHCGSRWHCPPLSCAVVCPK